MKGRRQNKVELKKQTNYLTTYFIRLLHWQADSLPTVPPILFTRLRLNGFW